MLSPVLVTGPVSAPVSIDDLKAQARVSHDLEDDLLSLYISAATTHLDGFSGALGRALMTQTWRVSYPDFGRDMMQLPMPDVSSVVVTYYDEAGLEQTLAAENYRLLNNGLGSFVEFIDTFTAPTVEERSDAVTIQFVCGYGDSSDVPAPIKHAILLLAAHWYNAREAVMDRSAGSMITPLAVNSLISPYRRVGT